MFIRRIKRANAQVGIALLKAIEKWQGQILSALA